MSSNEVSGAMAALDALGATRWADPSRPPSWRREVGLAVEAFAKLRVVTDIVGKHLQGIATRQPWMLGQVYLAHPPGSQAAAGSCSWRTGYRWLTAWANGAQHDREWKFPMKRAGVPQLFPYG